MSSIPIMIIFQASDSFDKFINYFLLTLLLRVVIDLGLASHTGKKIYYFIDHFIAYHVLDLELG